MPKRKSSELVWNTNTTARYAHFESKLKEEISQSISSNSDKLVSLVDGSLHQIVFQVQNRAKNIVAAFQLDNDLVSGKLGRGQSQSFNLVAEPETLQEKGIDSPKQQLESIKSALLKITKQSHSSNSFYTQLSK